MSNYIAVVHKEDDSAFGAYFPDLRGCYAAGDTEDEALANLRISLRIYAEDFIDEGVELPMARSFQEINADSEVREDLADGCGFLTSVPLLLSEKKKRVNVTLDPSLIEAIDEAAKISGTNRSDFLANAAWMQLKEKVGAVRAKVSRKRTKKNSPKQKAFEAA